MSQPDPDRPEPTYHGHESDVCGRCDRPIFDFCGTGWLTIDTEDETCGDGEHEPTNPRTEAERIGFRGYVGCPAAPCIGFASTCMASGSCWAENGAPASSGEAEGAER